MVQPLELSDALSKAELVGKLNQIQKAAPEMEQRQAASILKEKTTAEPGRTHQSEKSDMLIISGDKKRKEEKRGYRDDQEDDDEGDQDGGRKKKAEHLDLKI